ATDRGELPADIVILGLGTDPNTDLAAAAGIETGVRGGIVVDRRMRTSVDGVWAAGDCAEKFHLVSRRNVVLALGTHANKEGRVAGINLTGGYATFPGILGTAIARVCGFEVARTGLTMTEAAEAGFEALGSSIEATTKAGYFPGAEWMKIKLVVEARSGRLLGGQIVGKDGSAKRVDTIATALWNEMTVDEMLNLDLSYAPPFSPVWDPVLTAARRSWGDVLGSLRD
ncbi:MAG TPA: FAD-dependent oxidoreductase, partial [Actinomycetota bacterium]|nr:FAD-dependent oxidoreductase [Actinomycetota bacterium]